MKSLQKSIKEGIFSTSVDGLNADASTLFKDEYLISDFKFWSTDEEGYTDSPHCGIYLRINKLIPDVKKKFGLKTSMDGYVESMYMRDVDTIKALIVLLQNTSTLSYKINYIEELKKYILPGVKIEQKAGKLDRYGAKNERTAQSFDITLTLKKYQPLYLHFYIVTNIKDS